MNRDLKPGALAKPPKGKALLASRERTSGRKAAEQKEMRAALDRDGGGKGIRKCRFPACEFKSRNLPIDPCHMRRPDGTKHRGIGGDKTETSERTEQAWICSFCRVHHGLYDADMIDAQAMTSAGFDDIAAFYKRNHETGRLEHWASESRIGVSVPRT